MAGAKRRSWASDEVTAPAAEDAGVPDEVEASDEVTAPVSVGPAVFRVAAGRWLLCRRGSVGPGEQICEADLAGGVEALEHLVARGLVVRG